MGWLAGAMEGAVAHLQSWSESLEGVFMSFGLYSKLTMAKVRMRGTHT